MNVVDGGHGVDPGQLQDRIAIALKIERSEVEREVASLARAKLVSSDARQLSLTESGRALHGRIRAEIEAIVTPLYDGIPEKDLTTAGWVLVLLTERANAKLAAP